MSLIFDDFDAGLSCEDADFYDRDELEALWDAEEENASQAWVDPDAYATQIALSDLIVKRGPIQNAIELPF